jgi:DNA-binding PadR family transcriptional regulator
MYRHHQHHHRGRERADLAGMFWAARFGRRDDFARGFEDMRRGGRRRMFDGGELRLILLKLIEEQPRHGYDLIRELETRSGGAYSPSPGVIYPSLTLLADMDLIGEETSEDAGRKKFAITDAGRAHLAERAEEVSAAFARLQSLADLRERTDAAPIARAMHNLKHALHNRLSQPGVDKAAVLEVAALIDEAAGKIERL